MPNKTKIVFFIVAIVAVFSVYKLALYIHRIANQGSYVTGDSSADQDVQNCPTCDPDHDSLSNAQELAWGTDPFNPDTDGDGFKDGEEVASGHNPLIPGPNDLLSSDNLTDQFSQLAASGIFAGALNPASDSYAQSVSDIVSSVVDSGKYIFNKTVDPATLSTINNSTDSELTYLKNSMPLLKQFGGLLGQQFNGLADNLNTINQNGFGDSGVKSFFSSQASAYDTLNQNITAVLLPGVFKNSHARFLTLVQQMQTISDAVAHGDSDPIKASMAMNSFGDMYQNYLDLVNSYTTIVKNSNLDPTTVSKLFK